MSEFSRRTFLSVAGASLAAGKVTASPVATVPHRENRVEPEPYFDVRTFGAAGDGITIDSPSINKAIEAASNAGGGTVFVGPGTYKCFSIRLKSDITLMIGNGATIVAAETSAPGNASASYDPPEPTSVLGQYLDFGHSHWHNSLIWGEGVRDVAIIGGTVWGKGLSRGGKRDLPNAESPGIGNKSIALKNSHNIVLRDISILSGGHFSILATGVDNLTIDNLKIDTNRDGIDIDCCRNVRISNCSVNSPWDDAICLKSSLALGYARATENVTISNCYVSGYYEMGSMLDGTYKNFASSSVLPRQGGIKLGTESNGGFRNIAISNCVFEGCRGLSLTSVDGAIAEDISISGITMRNIQMAPLFLRLGSRMRGPQNVPIGELRRILISNIVCSNAAAQFASVVSGIPGHAIQHLQISNIFIQHKGGIQLEQTQARPAEFERKRPDPDMFGPLPASGLFLRHAAGVDISHVEIEAMKTDSRTPFILDDVDGAYFFRTCAQRNSGVPLFTLRNVRHFEAAFSDGIPNTSIDTTEQTNL